ncbi:MAG: hypoxanthine phosphoribosyltransferase [Candidatus Kapabacteria bacterium]|nr:hypoxanthine phosphoribosyltransferase [Candidatus Kapabacteria bacterium]MDW8012272.1 hypoxanthine phosphoribosyltransferase [Bacteroidota bacterium]
MPPETIELHGHRFRLFLHREKIAEIVRQLATQIERDYAGRAPVCLIVLKGAFIFAADLLRCLSLPCTVETIRARSYGMGMTSSGSVQIDPPTVELRGKDVLLLEDIVDTGLTLQALVDFIEEQQPASLRIATLLAKPPARALAVPLAYIGKDIPPVFVVGYGMDYAEAGRGLADIYAAVDAS